MPTPAVAPDEDSLRASLARADAAIGSARPMLGLLLGQGDHALFSAQILARIRGMIGHCADQLLGALAQDAGNLDREAFLARHRPALIALLLADAGLLSHAQALAFEFQMAERLQQTSGVDPVLPPMIGELCGSKDEHIAGLAMQVLTAQACFMQQQRRMELPLGELPGDLFHRALLALRACQTGDEPASAQCEQRLRRQFDDGERRVNRIARLVLRLGADSGRALEIGEAGVGLFVSALAVATAQDRELAVLALGENQIVRLGLSLRAAGLESVRVEQQLLALHPDAAIPAAVATIAPKRAAAVLQDTQNRWAEQFDGGQR